MKAKKLKVLPCASTGIASELLNEGTTAHRRFGIPNSVKSDDEPKIDRHSRFAAVLNVAHAIIIDEISMQDRAVLEYIDKSLRQVAPTQELRSTPFGGKVVVLGGDWKQLMPVVIGAGNEKQAQRSVKNCSLFK